MANKQIKDLTAITSPVNLDVLHIGEQATNTDKKVTVDNFEDNLINRKKANNTQTLAGTADNLIITPAKLKLYVDDNLPGATTTTKGVVELATNAETQAGSDNSRSVTPSSLSSLTATTSRRGLIEIATQSEAEGGFDTTRAMTSQRVKQYVDSVKQSSPLDTTADALMAVGAFGIGAVDLPDWPNTSLSNCSGVNAGLYRVVGSNTDTPDGSAQWNLLFTPRSVSNAAYSQLALRASSDNSSEIYVRSSNGGTPSNPDWSDWEQAWTTENLVKQTSQTDATAGRVMTVPAFGIGTSSADAATNDDCNDTLISGIYRVDDNTTANIPADLDNLATLFVMGWSSSFVSQMIVERRDGNAECRIWFRNLGGGSIWSDWVEVWTDENLVKTTSATDTTNDSVTLVGDFGIGRRTITAADLNAVGFSGIASVLSSSTVNGPTGVTGLLINLDNNNDATAQILFDRVSQNVYTRKASGGSYSDWIKFFTEANRNHASLASSNTGPNITRLAPVSEFYLTGTSNTTGALNTSNFETNDVIIIHKQKESGELNINVSNGVIEYQNNTTDSTITVPDGTALTFRININSAGNGFLAIQG